MKTQAPGGARSGDHTQSCEAGAATTGWTSRHFCLSHARDDRRTDPPWLLRRLAADAATVCILSVVGETLPPMDAWGVLATVEQSYGDHWLTVDAETFDGHHMIYVLGSEASISLAFGRPYGDHRTWTTAWSTGGGFPDSDVYGTWLDVRWNGVPILCELVLGVDGGRCYLPDGDPVGDRTTDVAGMKVVKPKMDRARLINDL